MKVARRKLDAAKRVNRTHSKYSFELTELCLSGLPEQVSSEALMVQCVRGPKLTATEEAEIDEEKLSRGEVLWPGQRLSFVATLYASKTGKEFSAKKYKVSLIGIRPAAFGTTRKLLKELSSAELNVSEFASASEPLSPSWASCAARSTPTASGSPAAAAMCRGNRPWSSHPETLSPRSSRSFTHAVWSPAATPPLSTGSAAAATATWSAGSPSRRIVTSAPPSSSAAAHAASRRSSASCSAVVFRYSSSRLSASGPLTASAASSIQVR